MSAPGTKRVIVALLACELVPVPFLGRVLTHPLRAIATKLFPPLALWEVWVLIRDTRALGARLEGRS